MASYLLFFDQETTHVEKSVWNRYVPVHYPKKKYLKLGTLIAKGDDSTFGFYPSCNLGKLMKQFYVGDKEIGICKDRLNIAFAKVLFG